MLDMLARQVASPVQFVKGLRTLYDAGRPRVRRGGPEAGPAGLRRGRARRRADDVVALFTNHPKQGDGSFNQALCGLYAAGLGGGRRSAADGRYRGGRNAHPKSPLRPRSDPEES